MEGRARGWLGAGQRPVGGITEDFVWFLAFFAERFSLSVLPAFLTLDFCGDLFDMSRSLHEQARSVLGGDERARLGR